MQTRHLWLHQQLRSDQQWLENRALTLQPLTVKYKTHFKNLSTDKRGKLKTKALLMLIKMTLKFICHPPPWKILDYWTHTVLVKGAMQSSCWYTYLWAKIKSHTEAECSYDILHTLDLAKITDQNLLLLFTLFVFCDTILLSILFHFKRPAVTPPQPQCNHIGQL